MGDDTGSLDPTANLSVADRVLSVFVDALSDEEDLADVAARLKDVLLGGKALNETTLREALFDEPSV